MIVKMLLQTLSIASVVLIQFVAIVDAKPKVHKKIANGQPAVQFPELYDYFKTIGFGVHERRFTSSDPTSQTRVIESCTGFFVQVKPSDANNVKKCTKVFYVSAAHCYPSYTPDSWVLDGVTHYPVLLLESISIRFGFNLYNTTHPRFLNINVTQNPIQISNDYIYIDIGGLVICNPTHDIAIVELSQSDIAIVKESHGKFVDFQDISYSTGVSGEKCWIAGFGGTTHESKLQFVNVTLVNDNSCFRKSCDTKAHKLWQFCYNRVEGSAELSEHGDSGTAVWCLRDGVYKVVSVHNAQSHGDGFVATLPAYGTRGERLSEMFIEAYKRG